MVRGGCVCVCVCKHTPCSLPWRLLPCRRARSPWCLCSRQRSPSAARLGRRSFIAAGAAARVNSSARLPRACCPSNCCVVRRRVPPRALSDSSGGLASNSDVDPLSANNSLRRPPRGIAGRFSAKPAAPCALSPGWGAPARGQGRWKAGGTRRETRGESDSCSCQRWDKCEEINSYLRSKWGHGIRLWHASV